MANVRPLHDRVLIRRIEEAEQKVGAGIASFEVVAATRALACQIHRVDGTTVDFSYTSCISGRAKSMTASLKAAMRSAVADQAATIRFKVTHEDPCGLCSEPLGSFLWHVDHVHPFDSLAQEFLSSESAPPTAFDDGPNHQATFRREDGAFARRWQVFHQARAELRAVHDSCNLERKRK